MRRRNNFEEHRQLIIGLGLIIFGLITRIGLLVLFGVFSVISYFKNNPIQTHAFRSLFNSVNKSHSSSNIYTGMDTIDPRKTKQIKQAAISSVIFLFLLFLASTAWVVVDAGETGVQSLFGKVKDREFSSGFHLKNPFVRITPMNIRTQDYTMSIVSGEGKKTGDDSISALTKEGLEVGLDMTVLYNLVEDSASDVYRDVGLRYDDVIIRPQIRRVIRESIALYDAKDIYSEKRTQTSLDILTKLKEQLEPRGIIVQEVLLRNVQLPSNLADSIELKLSAEQDAQRYDFLLQKEEKEAERKRVAARGQRDAQQIINESLTPKYLQYLYIQNLKDTEGTIYVPTSPNSGVPLFRGL